MRPWHKARTPQTPAEGCHYESGAPSSPRERAESSPRTLGSLLAAPSPALTWVAEVEFVVRVTVVAPAPEGGIGFGAVADKDGKEDGGGALEEEAQQGQLQSPARGAAGGPGHG